jgi:hypothetical protein
VCHVEYSAFLVVAAADFLSVFRARRHRPVAADDVRKMLLLVEVPVGLAGATVVFAVVVVLVAEVALVAVRPVAVVAPVVVLVVAVDVAAVEVVVLDPWEYIP